MQGNAKRLLATEYTESLDELFSLGASSGGARPKILTEFEGDPWIIKFPALEDKKEIGRQEYDYAVCAGQCGIEMSETRLFASKNVTDILVQSDLTGEFQKTEIQRKSI